MVAVSVSLSDITQLSDLASHLGVDVRALQLVSLHPTTICKGKTCLLPAAESNRGYCILCAQQWFPRDTSAELNRRGHGLFGPKFLRMYNNCQSPPKACCCDTPLCEKIGYSHEGMLRLPSKSEKDVRDFVTALGIQDKTLRSKMISDPRSHLIAPWHISPDHRELINGRWRLKKLDVYKDRDGKGWNFAPPNHALQDYVNVEIHEYRQQYEYCRNGYDDSLPNWFKKLARMQKKDMQISTTEASVTPSQDTSLPNSTSASLSKPKRLTFATPASAPRPRSKRTAPETIEISNLNNKLQRVESEKKAQDVKYQDQLQAMEQIITNLEHQRDNALRKVGELTNEVSELQNSLEELRLKQHQLPLSYNDLKPGGALGKCVSTFTFFPTFKANDAFLDLLNFTEGCDEGDGLCENMRRYSTVSMAERMRYNGMGSDDDMSISEDDCEDEEEDGNETARGRKRSLDWKTEWLVYCCYVKCGMNMEQIIPFFGIGQTKVHNIVYAWANVLCLALREFFPTPTRSQMLRAYPQSMIRKLGHAKIFMLLDATEWFADVASMKSVNAILFSHYKHNSTGTRLHLIHLF